jgi:hypothetical protein
VSANIIPNEALTAVITESELGKSASVDSFMQSLTVEQQSRFQELAHHLVYIGFINGQDRPAAKELTPEQKAAILINQTEFMLLGAGIIYNLDEDGLLYE